MTRDRLVRDDYGQAINDFDDSDAETMRQWFPKIREVAILDAGHNVHVENRRGFLEALKDDLRV